MRKNQELWLQLIQENEGGYVNDPRDKGLATNMGITQSTLSSWRGKPVSAEDVKALTWDEARVIYLTRFWNRIRGDELPGGLDVALGDAVVTSRMSGQVKILQGILGIEQDGFVGPKTIEAARKADTAEIIKAFFKARVEYLQTLSSWHDFGRGWTNRCTALQDDCLALVESNAAEARAGSAAAETGLLALVALLFAQAQALAPELIQKLTGAHEAATAHDWATFASLAFGALAIGVPAAIRFYLRVRAYVRGQPA